MEVLGCLWDARGSQKVAQMAQKAESSLGVLQMKVNNLHAIQFVETPFLVRDVDQFCGALIPIIGNGGKTPRKYSTLGGIGSTVSKKQQWNLVGHRPFE